MELRIYAGILATLAVGVVAASFQRRYKTASIFAIIATFFVRAVPNLPPEVIWVHDAYRYYSGTIAILESHYLTVPPEIGVWMPIAERAIAWPGLHLLSAIVVELTAVPADWMLRYFAPLFGPILFLSTVLLFKQFVYLQWAVIGSFFTSMLDLFVFFQRQYHQQGFAILFAIFLVYWLVIVSRGTPDRRTTTLGILFWTALLISHISTTIIVLFLFVFYITGAKFTNRMEITSLDVSRVLMLVVPAWVAAVGWNLYIYSTVVKRTLSGLIAKFITGVTIPEPSGLSGPQTTAGASVLDQATLLIKFLLVVLALPAVYLAVRDRRERVVIPALLLVSAGITAAVFAPIRLGAVTRTVLFGYLALGAMVIISQSHVAGEANIGPSIPIQAGVAVLVVVLTVGSGMVAYAPSMVDTESDVRADGFHEVTPPGVEEASAGRWMGQYISDEKSIGVDFWARVAPAWYGRHPISRVNTVHAIENANGWTYYNTKRWGQAPPGVPVIYTSGDTAVIWNS